MDCEAAMGFAVDMDIDMDIEGRSSLPPNLPLRFGDPEPEAEEEAPAPAPAAVAVAAAAAFRRSTFPCSKQQQRLQQI